MERILNLSGIEHEIKKNQSIVIPIGKRLFIQSGYLVECFNEQWLRFIGPRTITKVCSLPHITYLGIAKKNKLIEMEQTMLTDKLHEWDCVNDHSDTRETIDLIAQNYYARHFPANKRAIIFWKNIAEDIGIHQGEDCVVPNILIQNNIADCLGISREYLNSIQQSFTKKNMMSKENGKIILKNWSCWCRMYQEIFR
ncbi:hypothetical protein [Listeria booriae]|uniref:Uncharacterized protein n=1 Tax=Listeria booriae TaxID=1552123 RepID=A0A7X0XIC1_9LIST|nr:hypothetical protein [Listeria booriae]MBC1561556.1 hypothetical protein [Listeria booriae]MBC1574015.1 hypothetical protein [Listeria booriae]